MAHSSMLHVRVDDEIKTQASEALAAMGLSLSDAVRILLKRVVTDQAFPLELKVPNAQTRAAMEEAREIYKERAARFDAADALINDLEEARKQTILLESLNNKSPGGGVPTDFTKTAQPSRAALLQGGN